MLAIDTVIQRRYRILDQVGRGGMGTVYLARDENLGVHVALKQSIFDEQRLIEAFKREARLLAGLRHPALPQVKDYFVNESGQFLVMEYISGDDFGAILEKRQQKIAPVGVPKPFEFQEVLPWAEQLLDALDYLHTLPEPVIHRDIKPQNLKLAARNQIILLDFGLAKGKSLWMTRMTTTGSIYGYTPNYAPLEQIRGAGTDPRSDLYSLGATLYHLLTGRPPVDAATRADAVIGGEPDPLLAIDRINPQIPRVMADVLMKAMAPHRNHRPASAAEMLAMLRAAKLATAAEPRSPESITPPPANLTVAGNSNTWPPTETPTHTPAEAEQTRLREGQQTRVEAGQELQTDPRTSESATTAPAQCAAAEAWSLQQEGQITTTEAGRLTLSGPNLPTLSKGQGDKSPVAATTIGPGRSEDRWWKTAIGTVAVLIGLSLLIPAIWILAKKWHKPGTDSQQVTSPPTANYQTGNVTKAQGGLKDGDFVRIPAGEFMMGSEHGEDDEKPVHRVRISQGFEMGKYEVTQIQWETLYGYNPSYPQGADLPVVNVHYFVIGSFINGLNQRNDGYRYRLPTEAEWEYACRAGSPKEDIANPDAAAWYDKNSGNQLHPVGQKQPNAWGLYDMQGNAAEWCDDSYSATYYAESPGVDPEKRSSPVKQVVRGGSWRDPVTRLRPTCRLGIDSGARETYIGFRLVRTPR